MPGRWSGLRAHWHPNMAEMAAAVGIPGTKVCREMTVGIGTRDWVRGTVLTMEADKLVVRIDDAGKFQHTIAGFPIGKTGIVRDAPQFWTPCLDPVVGKR